MATTPTYINQRINNLQAQINSIISGGVPTTSDLAVVLANGNSAGTNDIDLNGQSITSGTDINVTATTDINLTADITATGIVNVNAFGGVLINRQGLTPPNITTTSLDGSTIGINSAFLTTTEQVLIDNTGMYINTAIATAGTESYSRVSPNQLEIYDHTNNGNNSSRLLISSTEVEYQRGGTKPTFYEFKCGGGSVFRMNNTGINMGNGGIGVQLNPNNIRYPSTYNTAGATLTTTTNATTSNACQTFNGSSLTATLPNASATNVGTQYIITNTNATSLTVTTVGGTQLFWSSTGAASATTRTLATGHSQIFTAIQTTGASTYGWSMV